MESVKWIPMAEGEPFPARMQGRWVEDHEPDFVLVIRSHELTMRRKTVEYTKRLICESEDGLSSVEVIRPFDRESGDGLAFDLVSGDEMFVSNIHFASRFVRDEGDLLTI